MSQVLSSNGTVPARSLRKANVGSWPTTSAVQIRETTHVLTYVSDISKIDTGPVSAFERVRAWEIDNGELIVKAIAMGGNLVSIQKKVAPANQADPKNEYIWLNKEGAVNYGPHSDAFPLTRGLILHGGIRVAAVTAEHGLTAPRTELSSTIFSASVNTAHPATAHP